MTKQKKILIGLLLALALLFVLYFAVVRPLGNRKEKNNPFPVLERLEGEEYYYGSNGYVQSSVILYPQFSRGDTAILTVTNEKGTYSFTHVISDASDKAQNFFLLGVDNDGDGETEYYTPPISSRYENFDYSSLYDSTSKIPSAMIAAGIGYFKDRVYIRSKDESNPTDAEYEGILSRYGLAEADDPAYFEILGYELDGNRNIVYETADQKPVHFEVDAATGQKRYFYGDESKTPYTGALSDLTPRVDRDRYQRIYVGDRTPDKTGYYLRVAGRDIVYTSGTTTVGDLVFRNLGYYVIPRLITATSESYAPFMPVDFRIWTENAESASQTVGGSGVVGYYVENVDSDGIDLGADSGFLHLMADELDGRLKDALLGASVGDRMTLTDIDPYPVISPLAEGNVMTYEILAVLGIAEAQKIVDTVGTVVEANDAVFVKYRLRAGDEAGEARIGVADLARPGISPALREALIGKAIASEGVSPIAVVPITLDESYADKITYEYRITAIAGIASKEDLSDVVTKVGTKLPSSGYAVIEYTVEIDGIIYTETATINLAGETTYLGKQLRRAILSPINKEDGTKEDRAIGSQSDLLVSISYAYSPISSYTVYENLEIKSYTEYKEEISFGFVNELERNPFYGSNLYEITGPADRTMYSLDAGITQSLLEAFSDLQGLETVHVGLSPEVIREYGLSAHVLYFEMPFGIHENKNDGNADVLTYAYDYSIGYYLYVSERQSDGTYFVASTQYDLVAKVSGDAFSFIDWEFGRDWAHKNILLVDVADIMELSFDINFGDLKESHTFALTTNSSYYVYAGINAYGEEEWTTQDRVYVWYVEGNTVPYKYYSVSADQVALDSRQNGSAGKPYYTRAGRMVTKNGSFYVVRDVDTSGAASGASENLDARYERLNGKKPARGIDYEGVHNFKSLLQLIYLSYYSGTSADDLDAAEREALLAAPDRRLLTVRMQLTSDTALTEGGDEYELSFYRYSDARCLIRFENKQTGAVSTEFYLHYAEVKNLVTAIRTLVAGGEVVADDSWLPDPPVR